MTSLHSNHYLESRVLTAPPQRLHLMLIETAIRFGTEAQAALERDDILAASTPLMRVIDVLGELLAGMREKKTDLNKQIAAFYTYLFRIVAEAKVNDDVSKLTEALGLLEFERETWQLVCDKIGNGPAPPIPAPQFAAAKPAQPRSTIAPALGGMSHATSTGFSCEA
jgi:flagellar protein FliS